VQRSEFWRTWRGRYAMSYVAHLPDGTPAPRGASAAHYPLSLSFTALAGVKPSFFAAAI
jgi:hypothetical protein